HWNADWKDWANQPVVSRHLKVLQCPSAEPNRVLENTREMEGGKAGACSDYAGIREVPRALVDSGLVDRPANPAGILMQNVMTRLADVTDGTSHTLLYAEDAGRPQLWQAGNRVPGELVTGGPWAGRNLIWGSPWDRGAPPWPCAVNCTNHREIYSF